MDVQSHAIEIPPVSPHQKKMMLKKNLVAYSFIAPNFVGFAVFTLGPIIFAFILAFLNWDGSNAMTFAGLSNFAALFSDARFKIALWNTIVYTVATVPLTMAAALFLAILLNQKLKGRNFFRTVSFFPYVASLVAVTVVWNMMFLPGRGPVNNVLALMGVANPPGWATSKDWAMISVIMFSIWKNMGYYMIIYLAGLQGIDRQLYEASSLDGATAWQRFRFVTLPQLRSTNFFVLIMLTIACFKVYDIVYMLTMGGPGTSTLVLVYHIYNTAFISWNLGYASAIAMVLFLLVLAVTLVQMRGERRMK